MIKLITNIITNIEIKCIKHNIILDCYNSKSSNVKNKITNEHL